MKETLTIYQKLSKIQKEFKAKKSRYNSFGKYNFRSAEDILEALKPFNEKYGVLFTVDEQLVNIDGMPIIESTATIMDSQGGMSIAAKSIVGVDLAQKGMQVPQQFGSASSYAKKYSLGNLLLIDDTQDSDATNDHSGRTYAAKVAITKDQLTKAKEYVKSGGNIDAIKSKYTLTASQVKELSTL